MTMCGLGRLAGPFEATSSASSSAFARTATATTSATMLAAVSRWRRKQERVSIISENLTAYLLGKFRFGRDYIAESISRTRVKPVLPLLKTGTRVLVK